MTTAVLSPPRRTTPSATAVIVATAVATAALVVAGVTVAYVVGPGSAGLVIWTLTTLMWLGAALVLAHQPSRRPLALLIAAGAIAGAINLFATGIWLAGWHGSWATAIASVGAVVQGLSGGIMFHLVIGLPDGRLVTIGRRVLVAFGYATALVVGVVLAIEGRPYASWSRLVGPAALVAAGALSAWYVRERYLYAEGGARRQLQWLTAAVAATAWFVIEVITLNILFGWPRQVLLTSAVAALLVPLGLATDQTAVARRADRSAVWALSGLGGTAVANAVFLLFVVGLGHRPQGGERTILLGAMVAMTVMAAGFVALRRWIVGGAVHAVYGERHPADQSLRVLRARLSRAVRLDELLTDVTDALAATQGTAGAELWIERGGDRFDRAVSTPARGPAQVIVPRSTQSALLHSGVTGGAWTRVWLPELFDSVDNQHHRLAPIAHSGRLFGLMVVSRSADGDPFTDTDHNILAELARQLGLALHNAQLDSALTATLAELRDHADELRASRARVVAAADAERRRIERDLHDGAQQQLVAMAVSLGLARDLVSTEPDAVCALLDEMSDELRAAIDDLRSLAHGIYPPLLADRGLGEALHAVAMRSGAVHVAADGIGRYSADVETAVYFCCLEALQNCAKHAPDATVWIRLVQEPGWLEFSITDDGPGFDPDTIRPGHGLVNMSDRMGSIGGSVTCTAHPGAGTVVSGGAPTSAERVDQAGGSTGATSTA